MIGALAVLVGGAGATHAQNVIANGNFTANAAAFTVWPGYLGGGGVNPADITSWGGSGGRGVNGAGTVTDVFGPLNAGGRTYAFIQGVGQLTQDLPGTYAPSTVYQLNFEAAGRGGYASPSFEVLIDDGAQQHFTTQVGGVDLLGNPNAFDSYIYLFTTPPNFYGLTPVIYLKNIGGIGSDAIDFANVGLHVATNAVVITQQPTPAALTNYMGGTVTFTAAAIGTNTVSYRWRHAGTNLSDNATVLGHHDNEPGDQQPDHRGSRFL